CILYYISYFIFNATATTKTYTLSLHDALPISRRFMVDLASRINLPTPMDIGERPGIVPQISTDGFNAYPEAVDLGFGAYCRYGQDRKSTRLNSSHVSISYAVFCLKKKK